ncbi:MAG: hypothetical protein WC096_04385 [Sphaerochaetaceae bacterium]
MSQVYLLEIVYLVFGSLLLLSDSHGVKYPLLLTMRYGFRNKRWLRILLVCMGWALTILSMFVPYDPGPMFLGDLIVTVTIFNLTLWYIAMSRHPAGDDEGKTILDEAATYIERNKEILGFLVAIIACIHFLVPMLVLL